MCDGRDSQESGSRPSKRPISRRSARKTPHRTDAEALRAVGVVSLAASRAKEALSCAVMPASGRILASRAAPGRRVRANDPLPALAGAHGDAILTPYTLHVASWPELRRRGTRQLCSCRRGRRPQGRTAPADLPPPEGSGSVSYEPLANLHGLTSLSGAGGSIRRWREHPAALDAELARVLELPQDLPALDR